MLDHLTLALLLNITAEREQGIMRWSLIILSVSFAMSGLGEGLLMLIGKGA